MSEHSDQSTSRAGSVSDRSDATDPAIEALLVQFYAHEMPPGLRLSPADRAGAAPATGAASAAPVVRRVELHVAPRSAVRSRAGGPLGLAIAGAALAFAVLAFVSGPGGLSVNSQSGDVAGSGRDRTERIVTPSGDVELRIRERIRENVRIVDPASGAEVDAQFPELDIEVFYPFDRKDEQP
ncbi:MAG: hypothetical protein KY476_02100 [Planctomycetes bacterium]|nr:hypothetical protein [Planctomycetota bacterium]